MDFLPQDLEDIIMDYKVKMENYDNSLSYINNFAHTIDQDIFTININPETKLNDILTSTINFLKNNIFESFNIRLNNNEILKTIIKNINPNIINWNRVGNTIYDYPLIHELSVEFIREFQDRLDWKLVGYYSPLIHELPIEFVREFQDRLDWDMVGHSTYGHPTYGHQTYNFPLIHELPIEFVREFQDRLNWTHNMMMNAPIEFVREFQDRLGIDYFNIFFIIIVGIGLVLWKKY